jgi:hypothetical protein
MYAISNAFFKMMEVVQTDRWNYGPLEIAFVNGGPDGPKRFEADYAITMWNMAYAGGHLRPGDIFDSVTQQVPGIENRRNPNIFIAPKLPNGMSELHSMLASLLPDRYLADASLSRPRANMALSLVGRYDLDDRYASRVEHAFAKFMWSRLSPGQRARPDAFAANSPLKLLAGDARFWMQRLYRVAINRREGLFGPVPDDPEWKSMDVLEKEFREQMDDQVDGGFVVRRPLYGGTVWDAEDAGEREAVIEEAIYGDEVEGSLAPVIELLNSHRAHEDFSDRYSWIKEDFQRSFYSKRAKLKVELIDTIDDTPVWDSNECDGYSDVLFRDVLAALDVKERTLLLAIRSGKTVCEISSEAALRGHASISRRLSKLKEKVARLLQ